jgi:hypothetical protein
MAIDILRAAADTPRATVALTPGNVLSDRS